MAGWNPHTKGPAVNYLFAATALIFRQGDLFLIRKRPGQSESDSPYKPFTAMRKEEQSLKQTLKEGLYLQLGLILDADQPLTRVYTTIKHMPCQKHAVVAHAFLCSVKPGEPTIRNKKILSAEWTNYDTALSRLQKNSDLYVSEPLLDYLNHGEAMAKRPWVYEKKDGIVTRLAPPVMRKMTV
jgi:hypothetical protein